MKNMNLDDLPQSRKDAEIYRQFGYEMARGAIWYVAKLIFIGWIAVLLFSVLRNYKGWGVDDSDLSGWERSGLRVYTDHKTGLQYLSDGRGGLVLRASASLREP